MVDKKKVYEIAQKSKDLLGNAFLMEQIKELTDRYEKVIFSSSNNDFEQIKENLGKRKGLMELIDKLKVNNKVLELQDRQKV